MNDLIYQIEDKPPIKETLALSIQQLLAISAATITVPMVVGNGLDPSAAMFGAGVGTLIYLFFTKMRSPVFLGSSFAFIGSMLAAFAGASSVALGYLGLIIGALFAGLVYVILSFIIKAVGTAWIDKFMPPVVIGPTVAIIGLSLAGSAITNFTANGYWGILCGTVTLFTIILISAFGSPKAKMIPFILGILAGYLVALIFAIGGIPIIDLSLFNHMQLFSVPNFVFTSAFGVFNELTPGYILTVAVAYVPVSAVVFAEHLADHKNLSTIIHKNLIEDPGLNRTLLGDGIGSIGGAFFGGACNTTYGESIATTAFTKSASTYVILITAIECILVSFIGPISVILASIPACVMGACTILLYGFIASSGLKMFKNVDFEDIRNIMIISVILVTGIGGLTLSFGAITLTSVACALILGIITNLILFK